MRAPCAFRRSRCADSQPGGRVTLQTLVHCEFFPRFASANIFPIPLVAGGVAPMIQLRGWAAAVPADPGIFGDIRQDGAAGVVDRGRNRVRGCVFRCRSSAKPVSGPGRIRGGSVPALATAGPDVTGVAGNNAEDCIRSALSKAPRSRRAFAALRIQFIELNRRASLRLWNFNRRGESGGSTSARSNSRCRSLSA